MPEQESQSNFEHRPTEEAMQSFEEFWSLIEAKVKEDSLLILKRDYGAGYTAEELEMESQGNLERFISREKEFCRKIFETISEIKRSNSDRFNALFDIDETIVKFKYLTKDKTATIFRPSLTALLDHIQKQGGEIGFFTTRGKEELVGQLKDEKHLKPVANYINTELVYSTNDAKERSNLGSERFVQGLEENFGGEEGIIDIEATKTDPNFEADFGTVGDMAKLDYLKEILLKLRGVPTMIVDDLRYPMYLNRKRGLYGVRLGDDSSFYF